MSPQFPAQDYRQRMEHSAAAAAEAGLTDWADGDDPYAACAALLAGLTRKSR